MLTIRLSRVGKKKQITYRLIISEKARDPYGRSLEILGSYNPTTKILQAKSDRINYWISKGAGLSPTVNNLLVKEDVITGKKVKATKQKKKKGEEENKSAPAPKTTEAAKEEKKEEPKTEEVVKEEPKKEESEAATTEAAAEEKKEEK